MIWEVFLGVFLAEFAKTIYDRYAKNGLEKRLERIESALKNSRHGA
jgi:hypothetical protein